MDVVNILMKVEKIIYQEAFNNAIISFKECLKANPQDKLSKTYIERCNLLITENPTDWDGFG